MPVGALELRWLLAIPVYALAYVAAGYAFWYMARKRGMATSGVFVVARAGLVGGLAGANLVQVLATGAPGKAIEGAIAGGWIAVILAKRSIGLKRATGDLFAVALSTGEMIGRIGCFIGGCCYGKSSNVAWRVYDHDAFRHPTQLYSSAAAAVTLAFLMWLDRRNVLPENGLFYVQGLLFCAFRFGIEFFRESPAARYPGITLVQIACLGGLAFFGYKLTRLLAPHLTPRREAVPSAG